MVRGEEGRVPPEDRRDRGFFLEFLLQKPPDLPPVPALRVGERPVERQIPVVELPGVEGLRLGGVRREG